MVLSSLKTRVTALNWLGWVFALSASFSFSVAPPVARGVILEGMHPTTLLLARSVLSGLLLVAITYLTGSGRLRIDRRGLGVTFLTGSISGVALLCFFWSLTRVDASMAAMMLAISPLMVLSLLALRGEKFTRRHIVRLILGLSGVYLLIGPGGQVDLTGIMMALCAVLLFSMQMAITQWFLRPYDAGTVTLYTLMPMTLLIGGWWLFQGAEWHAPGFQGWLAIVVLAVISTLLARIMLYAAIRRIGSGQMALLAPVETLLTLLWSILFLHERLAPIQWVGGCLVLTSALLAIKRLRRT